MPHVVIKNTNMYRKIHAELLKPYTGNDRMCRMAGGWQNHGHMTLKIKVKVKHYFALLTCGLKGRNTSGTVDATEGHDHMCNI